MTTQKTLNSIILIQDKKVISPNLITIREYGRWLQEVFDEYTCNQELYLTSKETGEPVLQYHPGTKIGNWFDRREFTNPHMHSWFILQPSTMMQWLKKYGLAESRDAVPLSVTDDKGRRMVRMYTADQIELYIRTNLDKQFKIAEYLAIPKQIKVREYDLSKIIIPETKKHKPKLF